MMLALYCLPPTEKHYGLPLFVRDGRRVRHLNVRRSHGLRGARIFTLGAMSNSRLLPNNEDE